MRVCGRPVLVIAAVVCGVLLLVCRLVLSHPTRRITKPTSESRARWVTRSPSPAPRPAASPRGECPAPWATVLPTSPPVCWCWPPGLRRCWVLGAGCGLRSAVWPVLVAPIPGCVVAGWPPRAAGLLVQAGDVVLVLMLAPPLGCGVVMLPDAGPRAARAPWVGLAMYCACTAHVLRYCAPYCYFPRKNDMHRKLLKGGAGADNLAEIKWFSC